MLTMISKIFNFDDKNKENFIKLFIAMFNSDI